MVDVNGNPVVSLNQISPHVKDKKDLYKSLLRNQYYPPPPKSSMLSISFMIDVIGKKYWLPHTGEVKVRACADPPKNKQLVKILKKVMKAGFRQFRTAEELESAFRRTMDRIERYPPP